MVPHLLARGRFRSVHYRLPHTVETLAQVLRRRQRRRHPLPAQDGASLQDEGLGPKLVELVDGLGLWDRIRIRVRVRVRVRVRSGLISVRVRVRVRVRVSPKLVDFANGLPSGYMGSDQGVGLFGRERHYKGL